MAEAWAEGPVDLDNCASEPIHVPGAIQPHGVLIAVDDQGRTPVVRVVSANLAPWFGLEPDEALGRTLSDVIGPGPAKAVLAAAPSGGDGRVDEVPLPAAGDGRRLLATLHRSGGLLVVEVEQEGDDVPVAAVIRDAAIALQGCDTVHAVAAEAVARVRQLTGFDRVMLYRFDAEWNGEVIAEAKAADLNTFLGLHYPATDIPAQARALYRRNWLRVIPDIAYARVELVPPVAYGADAPLDLSGSTLRSVSPIHVEYLSNMGVGASMSVSIIVGGELWGLIACHHYSGAHLPPVAARNAAEYLGQLISLRIAATEEADDRTRSLERSAIADRVADAIDHAGNRPWEEVLRANGTDILRLAGASGALVVAEGATVALGVTPAASVLRDVWAAWPTDHALVTDRFSALWPAAAQHERAAAGVMAFPLTSDRRELVVWFRPEQVTAVDWGGDPQNAKLFRDEGDHVRLSPRKSFDLWRQIVRGRSVPWERSEIFAAERFSRQLSAALSMRARDITAAADDLQRAMLPRSLPEVPGWRVDAHYSPAGAGRVGGDWYDAFRIGPACLALVIGDVAGHGLEAASDMAQLRNALRAYLLDLPEPGDALERLDRLMAELMPDSVATVACVVVDIDRSIARVAHAGHPPVIVHRSGEARALDQEGGWMLGVRPGERRSQELALGSGDAVVVYSDGVVERRGEDLTDGTARLAAAVERTLAGGVRPGAADAIAAAAVGDSTDDVTLLLLARDPA